MHSRIVRGVVFASPLLVSAIVGCIGVSDDAEVELAYGSAQAALGLGDTCGPFDPSTCKCPPGKVRTTGGCVAAPPRQIEPISTARIGGQSVWLQWQNNAFTTGARVEMCADRACTSVLSTTDVTGSSTVAGPFASGTHFWRLRPLTNGVVGAPAGSVWQFTTGAQPGQQGSGPSILDMNGDGLADFAVGALNTSTGAVYVAFGYRSAERPLALTSYLEFIDSANQRRFTTPLKVESNGQTFGGSVSSAGDVNGDGYGDLIVGANGAQKAYLYLGGPKGFQSGTESLFSSAAVTDLPIYSPTPSQVLDAPVAGPSAFGYSVAGIGDVDYDGYGDVAISSIAWDSNRGRVDVYRGAPGGLRDTPAFTLFGTAGESGNYGVSVAAAGDSDNDGVGELLVGESTFTFSGPQSTGRAYHYRGSAGGLITTPRAVRQMASGTGFGHTLAGVGDVDGDGVLDFLVGAWNVDAHTGRAFFFSGASSLSGTPVELAPPDGSGGFFGWSLGAAGDLNGDGFSDLVVGETDALNLAGRVHVFSGSQAGPAARTTIASSSSSTAFFGSWVTARDLTGDGIDDLIVGSSATKTLDFFLGSTGGIATTSSGQVGVDDWFPEFFGTFCQDSFGGSGG